MKKPKTATPARPEAATPKPQREARYSQAEIDARAMSLYSERYKAQPKELRSLNRQATLFYAECLKQAGEEMGPAVEFGVAGVITPAVVTPEVQAVIDRLAQRRASPAERIRLGFYRM